MRLSQLFSVEFNYCCSIPFKSTLPKKFKHKLTKTDK